MVSEVSVRCITEPYEWMQNNHWCKFFLNALRSLAVEDDSAPFASPVAARDVVVVELLNQYSPDLGL